MASEVALRPDTTISIDYEAILKSLSLNPKDPNTQALLLTCERYGLDPILKHAVLIQGRLYVTRDGLLHVAHQSKQLDGIEVLEQGETPTHHTAKVAVYRKDMSRPFTYVGRYPKSGSNKNYGPEMAVKVGEVMSLRRAFDISLAAREEVWDKEDAEVIEAKPAPRVIESKSSGSEAEPPPAVSVESEVQGETESTTSEPSAPGPDVDEGVPAAGDTPQSSSEQSLKALVAEALGQAFAGKAKSRDAFTNGFLKKVGKESLDVCSDEELHEFLEMLENRNRG